MKAFRVHRLKEDIKSYSRIFIYGAGEYGKYIFRKLKGMGILIEAFAITGNPEKEAYIDGIPILGADSLYTVMRQEAVITIIAVSDLYEQEIVDTLIENQICQYLRISTYEKRDDVYKNYCGKSEEEYLIEIAKWYEDCYGKSYIEVLQDLEVLSGNRKEDGKVILFLVGHCTQRTVKIASALKNQGYSISVIEYPEMYHANGTLEELESICDEKIYCSTAEEIMYTMLHSNAFVAHAFSYWGASTIEYILLQRKALFPKIVFEKYDILNGMGRSISSFDLKMERYCMEHADGVSCRSYELEYLVDELKFQVNKSIMFFDYCSDIDMIDNFPSITEEELAICYVGGVPLESEYPSVPYACFLALAEICREGCCHFHVYPSIWCEERLKEYIECEKNNPYFHLHKPVSNKLVSKEISRYDYGIFPVRSNCLQKENQGEKVWNKIIYSAVNKFFDYLDAGLPIIALTPVKFSEEFEKKDVLIRWGMDNYDFQELMKIKNEMKKNVLYEREYWNIKNKIKELIQFYCSL